MQPYIEPTSVALAGVKGKLRKLVPWITLVVIIAYADGSAAVLRAALAVAGAVLLLAAVLPVAEDHLRPRRRARARIADLATPLALVAALALGLHWRGGSPVPDATPPTEDLATFVARAQRVAPHLDRDARPRLELLITHLRTASSTGDHLAEQKLHAKVEAFLAAEEQNRPARAAQLEHLEVALRNGRDVDAVVDAAMPLLDSERRDRLCQLRSGTGPAAARIHGITRLLTDAVQAYREPLPMRIAGGDPVAEGPRPTPRPVRPPTGAPAAAPTEPTPTPSPTDAIWTEDLGPIATAAVLPGRAPSLTTDAVPEPQPDAAAPTLRRPPLPNAAAIVDTVVATDAAADRLGVACIARGRAAIELLYLQYDRRTASWASEPVLVTAFAPSAEVSLRFVGTRTGLIVGEVRDGTAIDTFAWPVDGAPAHSLGGHNVGCSDAGWFVGVIQRDAGEQLHWLAVTGASCWSLPLAGDAATATAALEQLANEPLEPPPPAAAGPIDGAGPGGLP